jgi:tRNA A22 N-methylase
MKSLVIFLLAGVVLLGAWNYLISPNEIIVNKDNLTVKEFLKERGVEVRNEGIEMDFVYPTIVVSDKPLKKRSYKDALYDFSGPLYVLFTYNSMK